MKEMDMATPTTCGQGIAENAVLPAKLGELTDAVAGNLEAHLKTLDLRDEYSTRERDVYVKLAEEHRTTAARLQATAQKMASYRDLPMGRHDLQAISSPEIRQAFETLVKVEQELLTLLQGRIEQHQKMLAGAAAQTSSP
jgi:hypothetical protein